jgi:hypothetical protein
VQPERERERERESDFLLNVFRFPAKKNQIQSAISVEQETKEYRNPELELDV